MNKLDRIPPKELLVWLQTKQELPNPRTRLRFVAHLWEFFGQRHALEIQMQLNQKTKELFAQLSSAYIEIQSRLMQEREVDYGCSEQSPKASVIVEDGAYWSEAQSVETRFGILKKRSYEILPFPQKALMYPNHDEEVLAKIEENRKMGFRWLTHQLSRITRLVESSAITSAVKPSSDEEKENDVPQKEEGEIEGTELFYRGIAFYRDTERKEPVYFDELIRVYNPQVRHQMFDTLKVKNWIIEPDVLPNQQRFNDFSRCSRNPVYIDKQKGPADFTTFLINCSIKVAEGLLPGVRFSAHVKQTLMDAFQDETVREDVCYYISDSDFYKRDLQQIGKRASVFFLYSVQIYLFIVDGYMDGYRSDDRLILLDIIFHRTQAWGIENLDACGFPLRCISTRATPMDPRENAARSNAFVATWPNFMNLLVAIEWERQPKDPFAFPLFCVLWDYRTKNFPIDEYFIEFASDRRFAITCFILYKFCETNPVLTLDEIRFLKRTYFEVLKTLEANGILVVNAHTLFFDPPIVMKHNKVLRLIEANTRQFVGYIQKYGFTQSRKCVGMLRQYFLHTCQWVFELLQDVGRLGIQKIEEELLETVCAFDAPWAAVEIEPQGMSRVREQALASAEKIQQRFRFSDTEIFLLYLEIIHLILEKKEELLNQISLVVDELRAFCPFLRKKEIYFLFFYHPEKVRLELIRNLEALRTEWAHSRELDRFIISAQMRSKILHSIDSTVALLLSSCENEDEQRMAYRSFHDALSATFFFRADQKLTDYCNIVNISAEKGIEWTDPTWETHVGQLKVILQSPVAIYVHWYIYNGYPYLLFSFFNIKKNTAFSGFVPLYVSVAELARDDAKRRSFYNLFLTSAKQVLREEVWNPPQEGDQDGPDLWIKCFALEEQFKAYAQDVSKAHIQEMWAFFKNLKCLTRRLFLCSITKDAKPPPLPSYDPIKVAALGYIVPSKEKKRSGLLPKEMLRFQQNPEFYLSGVDETFVVNAMRLNLFSTATKEFTPLRLDLLVAPGKRYPISYAVSYQEEAEERRVTLSVCDGKIQMPLNYSLEVLKDPSLFQQRLQFHTLILKTVYYYFISIDNGNALFPALPLPGQAAVVPLPGQLLEEKAQEPPKN